MPQPVFDPTKVKATMDIFPKGDYEVLIGEPKSFIRQAGKDKHDSYGVRFPYRIKEAGEYFDKTGVHTIYHHAPGAAGMNKQFLMAALGYGKGEKEEARFDAEQAGKDFSCDYETGAVGDFYRELTGRRVIMSTEPQQNKETGEPSNNARGWRPV